jgi:hypothetical protein
MGPLTHLFSGNSFLVLHLFFAVMEKLPREYDDSVAVYKAYLNYSTATANFGGKTFEFFPLEIIDELVSRNDIENSLKETNYPGSMRLFALAVYYDVSLPDLNLLITNHSDSNLPFPPDHRLGKPGGLPGHIFEAIRHVQDRSLAPFFRDMQYRDDFTGHLIPLEFAKGSKPDIGEGSGGRVYRARVRCSHFSLSREGQLSHGWSKHFALKVNKFRKDAEPERDFLKIQAKYHAMHKHITTFYTGFVFEQNIYLIAELADSNLDGIMEKYPEPRAVGNLDREWLLAQLYGLASALFTLYDILLYHHDIKPTNILVFNDISAGVEHRLKFTDFGSAGNVNRYPCTNYM